MYSKRPKDTPKNSSFSEFIRNATYSEKKKVFMRVLDEAAKKQQAIIKAAGM
ncbi:hypothetical protein [Endozoicomonas sp. 4G]|uniref:hypothetical protein n=1 Tax=Endozoicomonas sp. 4G TaxID=2872754 RepID=UPI00207898E9|nr:hypothetical protein [Endozoicomonas sp. 4G]